MKPDFSQILRKLFFTFQEMLNVILQKGCKNIFVRVFSWMLAFQTQCYWCRSIEIRQLFADRYLNKSRKGSVYWILMYFSNKELSCWIVSSVFSAHMIHVFELYTFNESNQFILTLSNKFFCKLLPQMHSIDFFLKISLHRSTFFHLVRLL